MVSIVEYVAEFQYCGRNDDPNKWVRTSATVCYSNRVLTREQFFEILKDREKSPHGPVLLGNVKDVRLISFTIQTSP